MRSLAAVALGAFLILPNLIQAARDTAPLPGQVSPDWREALNYLRDHTPHSPTYSVLAWWDSGYWISTVAQRIPVTNPTQNNAGAAANFLLATDSEAARDALHDARAQYVVVNQKLPMLGDEMAFAGIFPNLFAYTGRYRRADYLFEVKEDSRRRIFFRRRCTPQRRVPRPGANLQKRHCTYQPRTIVSGSCGRKTCGQRTSTSTAWL